MEHSARIVYGIVIEDEHNPEVDGSYDYEDPIVVAAEDAGLELHGFSPMLCETNAVLIDGSAITSYQHKPLRLNPNVLPIMQVGFNDKIAVLEEFVSEHFPETDPSDHGWLLIIDEDC